MGWWTLGLVAVVALTAGIVYAVWLIRARGEIPEETRVAIREAKQSRSECRRARKQHARDVLQARMRLQDLEDTKGRRLGAAGGITLYERWISTPQGSGSLVGDHDPPLRTVGSCSENHAADQFSRPPEPGGVFSRRQSHRFCVGRPAG